MGGQGEDGALYQCKICQEKFKTTSEFQKHKRLNHRKESAGASATEAIQNSKAVSTPAAASPVVEPNHTNGTVASSSPKKSMRSNYVLSSSQSERANENGVTIDTAAGRQLTCKSCRYVFDTRDPVVLHLIRQKRGVNGVLKCPYCVKSRRDGNDCLLELFSKEETSRNKASKTTKLQDSGRSNKALDTKDKRQSFSVSANNNNSNSSTPSTPTPQQLLQLRRTSFDSPTPGNSQQKHYELTKRKAKDEDNNSIESTPVKVSVLVNNNPASLGSRLAVPKLKEYEKGNISCQYCGFVAGSFREVQFHINTHLAKSFPCEFCSNIYRSKQGVRQHMEKHHPEQLLKTNSNGDGDSEEGSIKVKRNSKKRKLSMNNEDSNSQSAYSSSIDDNSSSSLMESSSNGEMLNLQVFGGPIAHHQQQQQAEDYFSTFNFSSSIDQHLASTVFGNDGIMQQPGRPVEKVLELANF